MWGGTTRNLRRRAQTVLNTAARWVTKLPQKTRKSSLMEAAGWFNIEEMTQISLATILWKIIYMKTQKNLHRILDWDPAERKISINVPRLQFTDQDFLIRSSRDWTELPACMRGNENLVSFKKQMKCLMMQ